MHREIRSPTEFYTTRTGLRTAELLSAQLRTFWPQSTNTRILGIGYTDPFLPLWGNASTRISVHTETPYLALPNPLPSPRSICIADESCLPFPDLTFDHILLVHALEHSPERERLLRSAWKVLKDHGSLLLVVPNRSGLWALNDSTPFGSGTPFSRRQLTRTLQRAFFQPERQEAALFLPPPMHRIRHRSLRTFCTTTERFIQKGLPAFGGVLIVEAVKDVWSGMPLTTAGVRASISKQIQATF